MRDALTLRIDGLLLHGTSHIEPGSGDLGVLFLNSGSLPRSSRGDLYAHLADALAARGPKCFRFDLPGLGDSQGEVPQEYVELYRLVQEGAYAGTVARIVRELRRDFGLAGVVLAGICGGAQTSVFATAKDRGAGVVGLVLLDMPFFLYRSSAPAAPCEPGRPGGARLRTAMTARKTRLRDWVLSRKWEPQATKVYYALKKLTRRTSAGALPPNTNMALLKGLTGLLEQGVPALMVTAHPLIAEPQAFDYIGYVSARTGDRVTHEKVRGTTHSFVENGGAEAVRDAIAGWLAKNFPAASRG
jgi:pimeloyl-ACP methyl ester carboxylesterase